MAKRRIRYSLEFKQEAVRLVENEELSVIDAAKDLGVNASTLGGWCLQARQGKLGGQASKPAASIAADEELRRLRKEVRVLREEREILKKAAAFFAKESR